MSRSSCSAIFCSTVPMGSVTIGKCAMTWCIYFYTCIACSFSTGTTMCPVSTKEVGQKGSAKLGRVPPVGLSLAERTEMYRTEAITSGSGYHRMYGETTNLRRKPLYLCNTSLCCVMEREGKCGVIRVGFAVLPGRCE